MFIARSKSRGPPDFKGSRATFVGRKRDAADSMEGQPSQRVKLRGCKRRPRLTEAHFMDNEVGHDIADSIKLRRQ
jgi:hypothetical protein